ncbi:MAG: hypothetical protein JSV25_12360, partial [Spirochaetota bacterium]
MPPKRLLVEFCALSGRILRFANSGVSLPQFMQQISKMLLDFSESDAVNLYIKADTLYHRCEAKYWPKKIFRLRSYRDSEKFWGDDDFEKLRKGVMENAFDYSS